MIYKFTLLLSILILFTGRILLYAGNTPVMNGNDASPNYYTETNVPVALFPDFTITNTDGSNIKGLVIAFTGGYHSDQDTLVFSSQNGITGTFYKSEGALVLAGDASPANYQTAVRSITYINNLSQNLVNYEQRTMTIALANSDYLESTGHFYEFVAASLTWNEAKTAASAKTYYGLQGYLATVTSAEENTFIMNKISTSGQPWLGGSDNATEGTWLWVTGPESGSSFSYSNWKSTGEPNNGGTTGTDEDYLEIYSSDKTEPGTWNDGSSTYTTGYVIEYGGMTGDPVLNMTTTTTLNIVKPQPPVIEGNDTSPTFFKETDTPVALLPAFTITDEENSNIKGLVIAFTGGYHSDQDSLVFTSQNGITGTFYKSEGALVLTGDASPANYQTAVRSINYINTASLGTTSYEQRTMTIALGNADYLESTGHFYKYVNTTLTFTLAQAAANASTYYGLQGYLSTITSAAENAFILNKISDIIWLGASDATTENTWKWIAGPENGTQFSSGGTSYNGSYVNWNSGEPNNGDGKNEEDYLMLFKETVPGTWNDIYPTKTYTYLVEYGGMAGDPVINMTTTTTLNVLAPQPPEIKGNDTAPTYIEGTDTPLAIFPEFTITDAEDSDIKGLVIAFTGGHHSDQDSLIFVDQNGITGSFYRSEGALVLTGDASPATYQTAVRSITYINHAESGLTSDEQRTMTIALANADYLQSTGHFYEYVSGDYYWDAAKAAAGTKNYYGLQGYLATATSAEETSFMLSIQDDAYNTLWLGGSDEETDGTWKWVTGPESGTIFYQNQGTYISNYTNWETSQPSNDGDVEDYLQFFTNSSAYTPGKWNDRRNAISFGYIVEYGGMTGDAVINMTTTTTLNVLIPPSDLSYADSPISGIYKTDIESASPTITGIVESYAINPSLPAGITIDPETGVISGTPTEVSGQTSYTVTASNAAGNTTATVQITIDKKELIITAENKSKEYDRTEFTDFTVSYSGFTTDEDETNLSGTLTFTGEATTATTVGNYTITPEGFTSVNYKISYSDGELEITPKELTVTATADNKVYDSATSATVSLSDDRVENDVVTVDYSTAKFDNKNTGEGKTVTISGITISGTDAGNYTLAAVTANTTANITNKTLTVTASAEDKEYDGNTSATVSLSDDRVENDVVTVDYSTAVFDDKNTGEGKTVTVSDISISGTDAGNYTLAAVTATTTADITNKTLNVTASAEDKEYDGNTLATVSLSDDRVENDVVTVDYSTAVLDDKNTGEGKTVTVSGIAISGTDAGNYTLASVTANTTANITNKTLTVTASAEDKEYDGNTLATVSLSDDRVENDVVTVDYSTAVFDDKNTGEGKTVTVSGIAISGTDAGNYTLASVTANTTANITNKTLTVTASAEDKEYDGNTLATVSLSDDRVENDVVTVDYSTAVFDDKNTGEGKTVTVSDISISGTDAGNYTLASVTANTTADITNKTLNVTASAEDKEYDGNTLATVSLSDDRVENDVVTVDYSTAVFDDKNTGEGKTVTVSDISISGTDAGNYTLASVTANTTANITNKTLTVTASAEDKEYDGNTLATVSLSDDRVENDVVTVDYSTAVFDDKNTGEGKTVTVSGIAISGTDAGNYTLASVTANTTANITNKTLSVTASAEDKEYDGNTLATVSLSDDRVENDVVTVDYSTAVFDDKNTGEGKTVTVSGIAISGTDAGNYTLASVTANTTANITNKTLTVTASAEDKEYDGNTLATVSLSDDRVENDVVTVDYSTAVFDDKNTGEGKTVTVSGIAISGTDAGNYTLASVTANTTANITNKTLTVTASAEDKEYDGNTLATVSLSDDRVENDVVTVDYSTAVFDDKNTGEGKTVTVSDISISGTDAGNYTLASVTANTTANITNKTLTVTASAEDKEYDGNTLATVSLSDDRVENDVVTVDYSTAVFDDKNTGEGKTVTVSGIAISGTDAGNYTLASVTANTTANITNKTLTVTASAEDKEYDGNTLATVSLSDDRVENDVVTVDYSTAVFDDKNTGEGKTVTVSGIAISGTDAGNYTLASVTANTTANITNKTLTVTASAEDKEYDGNTLATVSLSDDRVENDVVTVDYSTAVFDDKNTGEGKTVTVSDISISGTDAGNYTLASVTANTTANITNKTLTVTASAEDKEYDGNTLATVSLSDDRVENDVVTVDYSTAVFDDKNTGEGKTVTVSGIAISGTDAGNYTLASVTANTTANITNKTLTVTASAEDKEYDGNTLATVSLSDDRVENDVVTVDYSTAVFDDKNTGEGKTVTVSGIAISGTDAGNYTLASVTANTTANITNKTLTVTASAEDKEYDGNTLATVSLSDDRVENDVVTVDYSTAVFDDKNTGEGKTVTVSDISISGTDAGNYTLASVTANTTANITNKTLTVTASAEDKEYDGNTLATVSLSDDRVENDVVTVDYSTAVFDDKNTGEGKTVTVSGIAISGTDAGNYTLASVTANTTANITNKTLTVTASAEDKEYDGNTLATVSLSDDRVENDVVTVDYSTAVFDDKNTGEGKTVTVSDISISGTDAGNYTLASVTANTTANITNKTLTVTASAEDKEYDGNTLATVSLSDDRVENDVVTVDYSTAVFDDKNTGEGKTVTVSGIAISGTDAGNYTLASVTANTTANITNKTLTVTASAEDKEYDGNTLATVSLSDDRVENDVVTVDYSTAVFDDKNTGEGKTVTVSDISISGTDAGNYTLASVTANTTADITNKTLTVTASAEDKEYDGNTLATVSLSDDRVENDVVTVDYSTAVFDDKNTGEGKTVTVSDISISGTDAGNYTLASVTANTTANITNKTLTVTASAEDKEYDGNTLATVSLSDDRVENDVVTVDYSTAVFDDKNTGEGKTVTVSGIAISGTDAGNYTLASVTANTTANITNKTLTVTASAEDKEYDGNTLATVSLSDDRVENDVVTVDYSTAVFDDKNTGEGKTVTVSGIAISGTDAGNYTLASVTANTTANITNKTLTVTASAEDKEYDGNTLATVSLSDDRVENDVVTVDYSTAVFDDKNTGEGKTVTVSDISISGTDAGNYTLASVTANTTANITNKTLTVTASAEDKEYDGNTLATVSLSDDRVENDVVTVDYSTAVFDDKNTGEGKTVTVSGIAISGTDAGNYTLASVTANTTANITNKTLTVTASAEDKEYDGNTLATVSLSDDRVENDVVTVNYSTAVFDDKNTGEGKTVTVSDISISGTDAGNYTLAAVTATATADITNKTLTVTASADNKEYDGNTLATVSLSDDRVENDVVTVDYSTAVFDDKNTGEGKTVTVSDISISGTDAGNYTLAAVTATATADITNKTLTVTASADNKEYDGNTSATVSLSDDRVENDVVTVNYSTAVFDDKNTGEGKTVTVSDISISGTDAGNYTLAAVTANTTADITNKTLTVTASADNKEYDGNTSATVSLSDDRVENDVVTVNYSTAVFDDKNTGEGKTVTVSDISISGTDANNYTLAAVTANTTANITNKTLTVTASAEDKTYDGTTDAVISGATLIGVITNDDVTLENSTIGTFAQATTGTNIEVTTSMILSGDDADNYSLTQPSGLVADITGKKLTITGSFTAESRTYDGTTSASLVNNNLELFGIESNDDVSLNNLMVAFETPSAGNDLTVYITSADLTGNDAGQYSLSLSGSPVALATISQKAASIEGATTVTKTYDGNKMLPEGENGYGALSGILPEDETQVTLTGSPLFNAPDAGTRTILQGSLVITGPKADNYSLTWLDGSGTIEEALLTVTVNNATKFVTEEDDTKYAGINISGFVNGEDTQEIDQTGLTITRNNASENSTGEYTGVLEAQGLTAANYIFTYLPGNYSIIPAEELLVEIANSSITYSETPDYTVQSARYLDSDGNTIKDLTSNVTKLGDNYFAINDGTENTINITISETSPISNSSGNLLAVGGYPLEASEVTGTSSNFNNNIHVTGTLTVNTKGVDVQLMSGSEQKTFDGDANMNNLSLETEGMVTGDDVEISQNGSFSQSEAGSNISYSVSVSLAGSDKENYHINTPLPITGNNGKIIPYQLIVTDATAENKIYDGNTNATISGTTLQGVILGDDVALANETAGTFGSYTVGDNIEVTTAMTLTGGDKDNYILEQPSNLAADITVKELAITGATGQDKVYDGTTEAVITGAILNGVVGMDQVTLKNADQALFAQAATGTDIEIITSMSISGTDAGNYSLRQPEGLTADITPRELSVINAIAENKIYDGTADASISGASLQGIITDDDVTLENNTTGSFAQATTGTGIKVTTSMALSGNDADNYSLTQPSGLLADITKKELTIAGSFTAKNKTYDGTSSAEIATNNLEFSGVIQGDEVGPESVTLVFETQNAGNEIEVSITDIIPTGNDAAQYTVSLTGAPIASANIIPKELTVTADNKTKEYNGSVYSPFTVSFSEFATGENETNLAGELSFSGTAITAVEVGANYQIIPQGLSSSNYNIHFGSGLLEITKANQSITFAAIPRQVLSDASFNLSAYASSGLSVNFSSSDKSVAIISGTTVIFVNTGTCTIYASQPGNNNYHAAPQQFQTLSIVTNIAGDINGDGQITTPEIAGDVNGDGQITPPEIAGDTNGDGQIALPEITGDTDGNGQIDNGETAGDTNGNGQIDGSEIAGDTDGNGQINEGEVAGDTDGNGQIALPEIAGDTDGNGQIDNEETAGDTNGNGQIDDSEIAGDTDGNGQINEGEVAGDIDGNRQIALPEIAGDTDGNGQIDNGETAGDTNGNGQIDDSEIAGDTDGNGQINEGEVAGDINGDGQIADGEITGDTDGNGQINNEETAGDTNGNGQIDDSEIAGDTDGNGQIDEGEVAGDINGDGQIALPEITGDTDGNGQIDNGETAGDTNGNGQIDDSEIAGDTDGNGQINEGEVAGDINGDGQIADGEITGDTDGNGQINNEETAGDTNGNGQIDDSEIAGDTDGNGQINEGEVAGDINGDRQIADGEITGDTDGNGQINNEETAGDTNGNGQIDDSEIAGDTDGNGQIDEGEVAGDINGDGQIADGEITGDTDGNGQINNEETAGDTNGNGQIDEGETPIEAEPNISILTVDGTTFEGPDNSIYYLMDCGDTREYIPVSFSLETNSTSQHAQEFDIDVPAPGIYTEEIEVLSPDNSKSNSYQIVVEKRFDYDDIIIQKYNNVLLVNNNPETNGGYHFVSFNWYKNEQLIGSGQYYSAGDNASDILDLDAQYFVDMETEDGDVLKTCDFTLSTANSFTLNVAPNPVKTGNTIDVTTTYTPEMLTDLKITIRNLNGGMIMQEISGSNNSRITIPALTPGTYVITTSTGGVELSKKIVVQ